MNCLQCRCPLITFFDEKRTHCAYCQAGRPPLPCADCGAPARLGVQCARCRRAKVKRATVRWNPRIIEGGLQ